VLGTCHWLNTNTNSNASYGEETNLPTSTTEFHVYKLEWSESTIKIAVDDSEYYELVFDATFPFDKEFFLLFNIAVGGTLGGTIDPSFTSDMMEIDYVRVYQ
jgi:beta-glucanase (GH16 family)